MSEWNFGDKKNTDIRNQNVARLQAENFAKERIGRDGKVGIISNTNDDSQPTYYTVVNNDPESLVGNLKGFLQSKWSEYVGNVDQDIMRNSTFIAGKEMNSGHYNAAKAEGRNFVFDKQA